MGMGWEWDVDGFWGSTFWNTRFLDKAIDYYVLEDHSSVA
jgi:hypothetical protein